VTKADALARDTQLSAFAKASLAAEIVAAYVRIRYALRRADVRDVLAQLRAGNAIAPPPPPEYGAVRLARAVHRTLAFAPRKSRCLLESLVLTQLLSRRGIAASVVIGVQSEGEFAAHAWVELGSHRLLPSGNGLFEPLVRL
jgi:Transglutaminase-like superfamily